MIGETIAHYRVRAKLGLGGMANVYSARDKVKRDVALKVLPESFANDPERMARFQREAEVLASLNNPNIAHIYGVEDRALVMELVEGEAPKGPMPFDDAWKIASQIAVAIGVCARSWKLYERGWWLSRRGTETRRRPINLTRHRTANSRSRQASFHETCGSSSGLKNVKSKLKRYAAMTRPALTQADLQAPEAPVATIALAQADDIPETIAYFDSTRFAPQRIGALLGLKVSG